MKVYCDTSALVAITSREPMWQAHADWLDAHATERVLGALAWGELVDVTARRVRRNPFLGEEAPRVLAATRATFAGWTWLDVQGADIDVATSHLLADLTRGLKLADAIHIAAAQRINATLLTGDRQQATAAAELSLSFHLILAAPEI